MYITLYRRIPRTAMTAKFAGSIREKKKVENSLLHIVITTLCFAQVFFSPFANPHSKRTLNPLCIIYSAQKKKTHTQ